MQTSIFRTARGCAVLISALSLASGNGAAPIDYVISSVSFDVHDSGSGLLIASDVFPAVAGASFTLNDGESIGGPIGQIYTPESQVNLDDLVPQEISVTIEFTTPPGSATVEGQTRGVTLFGFIFLVPVTSGQGAVVWDDPVTVDLGDAVIEVSLNDGSFNEATTIGFPPATLDPGPANALRVFATIEQISSVDPGAEPIPSPAAALVGSAAMAGLFAQRPARRRRQPTA